jgi:hypothetical protein
MLQGGWATNTMSYRLECSPILREAECGSEGGGKRRLRLSAGVNAEESGGGTMTIGDWDYRCGCDGGSGSQQKLCFY